MSRLALVAALLVGVFLTTFEGQAQRRSRHRSRKAAAAKPSIQAEAEAEAKKLADKFVTKCGEDYYSYLNNHLVRWRGLHIVTQTENLSRADTFNGIRYKMTVKVQFDAQWFNGEWRSPNDQFCLRLEKRSSVWEADACFAFLEDVYGGVPPARKPNCGDIGREAINHQY